METKTALVTGATGAIGGAVALLLAQQGMKVWLACKSRSLDAEALRRTIVDAGGYCDLLEVDIRDGEACRKQISSVNRTDQPINVCVCCAESSQHSTLPSTTPEEWNAAISIYLAGFFHVTQPLLRNMIRGRAGSIIALGVSENAPNLRESFAPYTSKAGLLGAVRSLAREVGRFNVRVNLVTPGRIESSPPCSIHTSNDRKYTGFGDTHEMGSTEGVAEVIAFLASERASYITGANIAVNGGLGD